MHRAIDDVAGRRLSQRDHGRPRASPDQLPFLQAGFEVHERLHLLVRTLDHLPGLEPADLRRGHHADRPRVLEVDAAAFPSFWRLDGAGSGRRARRHPERPVPGGGRPEQAREAVVGYAVTGRAGPRGYLQRLAVQPDHQRSGIGGALVVDGLRWLRRWGAKEVLVNTQEGNEPAVRLYESLGFELRPEGLAVLRLAVGDAY